MYRSETLGLLLLCSSSSYVSVLHSLLVVGKALRKGSLISLMHLCRVCLCRILLSPSRFPSVVVVVVVVVSISPECTVHTHTRLFIIVSSLEIPLVLRL